MGRNPLRGLDNFAAGCKYRGTICPFGKAMTTFIERLVQAAEANEVHPSQSGIAKSLGMHRQTVNKWFVADVPPSGETILHIAGQWDVDAKWLETGEGEMRPEPSSDDLPPDERELLRNYRASTPKVRSVVRAMVRVARKSVVTIAAAIPPLLAAPQSEAASMLHYLSCVLCQIRWLRRSNTPFINLAT